MMVLHWHGMADYEFNQATHAFSHRSHLRTIERHAKFFEIHLTKWTILIIDCIIEMQPLNN